MAREHLKAMLGINDVHEAFIRLVGLHRWQSFRGAGFSPDDAEAVLRGGRLEQTVSCDESGRTGTSLTPMYRDVLIAGAPLTDWSRGDRLITVHASGAGWVAHCGYDFMHQVRADGHTPEVALRRFLEQWACGLSVYGRGPMAALLDGHTPDEALRCILFGEQRDRQILNDHYRNARKRLAA